MIKYKISKYLFLLFALFLTNGCSPMINKSNNYLKSDSTYAIGTFWNYTQTPMAGLKASSIVESILVNRGIHIISLIGGVDELEDSQNQNILIKAQREKAIAQNAKYLITGSVQEWRYKTGIDAEPAVSYSIKVIDLENNQIIFNGVGAKSGLSYQSIGEIAQEVANSLIPKFI
jgi:hypothetical protein